ncbi:glycosyl transferase [Carboxylicivirga sp. A043]|uniref:glycosyltransferase family protein n=1 Tax=Carboxylicivirga litoralis TaxID=2816963 RepID=UPI0021CB5331|nr:glycosyltransferase family protein [Carboxylicivirga sp. A043]MCU4154821.1 glycosyl transferase [Carboxylicivirga sp. A043]
MKILYAIQGTGNGHIARAFDVIPHLQRHGEVDLLVSGIQCDIKLPWAIKYRFYGLSFIFGKNGGVDLKETLLKFRPHRLLKEIYSVPVHQYDLVINDFEPVTAWACKFRNVKCVALSHQSAVLHPEAPKPEVKDLMGRAILKYYAPVSTAQGFHFKTMGETVSTPVIRDDIRWSKKTDKGHYTVYLPSYSNDKIIAILSQFPQIEWQVFSKHSNTAFQAGNVHINPVNKEQFTKSFVSSKGVLCNAGFETPAEALFLGKKLCVIPMNGQYEQQCNAAFLESMGVTRLNSFSREIHKIQAWLASDEHLQVNYPDNLSDVVDEMIYSQLPQTYPQLAIS